MAKNPIDDSLLLFSFKNGDKHAFESIYSKYYFLIYSVSLGLTSNSEDSKEVVNDVFASFWAGKIKIDRGQSLRNVLCLCAKNSSISLLRKRNNAPEAMDPEAFSSSEKGNESSLDQEYLESAISKVLDEEELYVFLAHIEKGLSFGEIAKRLGKSEDAASSIFTRSRKKLSQDETIASLKQK